MLTQDSFAHWFRLRILESDDPKLEPTLGRKALDNSSKRFHRDEEDCEPLFCGALMSDADYASRSSA